MKNLNSYWCVSVAGTKFTRVFEDCVSAFNLAHDLREVTSYQIHLIHYTISDVDNSLNSVVITL